jgi:glyoxylase-like metal-dependent hydrolase (beta-lactamase superfamily II)
MTRLATLILSLSIAMPAAASEEQTLDELLGAFGWDLATAEITTEKVSDGLYVLFGIGGNIGVSIGEQGVLVVDDQFPQLMPKIEAAIAKVGASFGARGVDFAINTHWHFDHAEGNLALGPSGTWIVAHANSRSMMTRDNVINMVNAKYRQKAYPQNALPVIAYEDRMQLHFNGEQIDLIHPGPAHTTGDTAVIFRKSNAVHLGDVFNNTGYPFIDADSGGEIDGMIAFCRAVRAELAPDAVVIPGHGKIADVPALERYIEMLQTVRDRIAAQIEKGASLEEVIASKPARGFEETFGDPANSLGFLDRAYTSLAKKR